MALYRSPEFCLKFLIRGMWVCPLGTCCKCQIMHVYKKQIYINHKDKNTLWFVGGDLNSETLGQGHFGPRDII